MPTSLKLVLLLLLAAGLHAQQPAPLDPTRNLPIPSPLSHTPLPEQYLWTAGEVTARFPNHNKFPWNRPELRTEPRFFRAHFAVARTPEAATLYLAGPRQASVFVNGTPLATVASNPDAPIGFHVFRIPVPAALLHPGDNVLALSVVRGRGIVAATESLATQQLAYGEVLAVKLSTPTRTLLLSDPEHFRSTALDLPLWAAPDFDDTTWNQPASLGPVESNPDFFQWNADAGMYGWPGYLGLSPHLRTYPLQAVAATHLFPSTGAFTHVDALTGTSSEPFSVRLPDAPVSDADAPALLLDFGREVAGRLLVESASTQPALLSIAYGESELEALATGLTPGQQGGNYLGTNLLDVEPNGLARGPKSAFRYVLVRFLGGAPSTAFRAIRLEGIYDPAPYVGSFECSDPLLNRIWETGAHTIHLAMQDDLWDAPKRDRGRWVGDLDVEGRVLLSVFQDPTLLQQTLSRLAADTPPNAPVNGIPGYSALWITTLHALYRHTGDRPFLLAQHDALLRILAQMDATLAPDGTFTNPRHQWLFVDWAPGLYAYTPQALLGTNLQYALAFRDASGLLRALDEAAAADRYSLQATRLLQVVRTQPLGASWQLNALALRADPAADIPARLQALASLKQDTPVDPVISPYFNLQVLDALAQNGRAADALAWLKTYWGGMMADGATSFFEAFDLRWPKGPDFALSLQADGTSGFFVSLAHGWSAGPVAWLEERVLGVTPLTPGFDTVRIAPRLLGLRFARGAVPTPHGPIGVSIDAEQGIAVDLPAGVKKARLDLIPQPGMRVLVDGVPVPSGAIDLVKSGHHTIATQ